jgi:invasion protein IalB
MRKTNTRWVASAASFALITLLPVASSAQQPPPRPTPQRTQPQQSPTPPPTPPASATRPSLSQAAPSAQAAPLTQAIPPAQATPAVQSNAPQRTTATYDDWVVQCETVAGPPERKVCEMAQVTQLQVQGKTQPFSRAVVPHPAKDQPVRLVVQLPVNVTFSTNVRVQISDGDQGLALPFTRCVPDGCFADFEIKEDTLKKFRSASTGGKLSFADASGRGISIPLSFNGFSKAYDALTKD